MNGRWSGKTGGSWTAVSKAPYLKAIALWGKGDCWHGGGLFCGTTTYWLNDGSGHKPLLASSKVSRLADWRPPAYYGGECLTVYYNRLQRDGWTMKPVSTDATDGITVFDKPASSGWLLRKFCHAAIDAPEGKGVYHDRHELVHARSGQIIGRPEWEWADLDGKRLVWAEAGRLHAAYLDTGGLKNPGVLHDFNDVTFGAVTAPY